MDKLNKLESFKSALGTLFSAYKTELDTPETKYDGKIISGRMASLMGKCGNLKQQVTKLKAEIDQLKYNDIFSLPASGKNIIVLDEYRSFESYNILNKYFNLDIKRNKLGIYHELLTLSSSYGYKTIQYSSNGKVTDLFHKDVVAILVRRLDSDPSYCKAIKK